MYIAEGSVDGETFLDFIRRCLIPVLVPFDGLSPNSVVVMDNASIHHVDSVVETILSVGAPAPLFSRHKPHRRSVWESETLPTGLFPLDIIPKGYDFNSI